MDEKTVFSVLLNRILEEMDWTIDSGNYYGSWWSDYASPTIELDDNIKIEFKIPTGSFVRYNITAIVRGDVSENYSFQVGVFSDTGELIRGMIKRIKEKQTHDEENKLRKVQSNISRVLNDK